MNKAQSNRPKRWAVAKKGYYLVCGVYTDREQAERCIKGKEDRYEVREIIA